MQTEQSTAARKEKKVEGWRSAQDWVGDIRAPRRAGGGRSSNDSENSKTNSRRHLRYG
jgi:hypothetical protein